MKKSIKKFIATIISILALICLLTVNSFAVSDGGRFSADINPVHDEYAKGEEIEFYADVNNISFDDLHSVVFEAAPSDGKGLFTAGINNRSYECFMGGENQKMTFSLCEESNIIEIGGTLAGISALLFSVYAFFIRKYYSDATLFITVSLIFTSAFASFPSQTDRLNFARQTEFLGSYSVIYDGEEHIFDIKVSYEKPKALTETEDKILGEVKGNAYIESDISLSDNIKSGIIFASNGSSAIDEFKGYLFVADCKENFVYIYFAVGGRYEMIASKPYDVPKECKMRIEYTGKALKAYILDGSNNPYPVFDLPFTPYGSFYGIKNSQNNFKNTEVGEISETYVGETYTNPVKDNSPDPYVLKYNGMYYLYATNMPDSGFEVYASTDLVNWQYAGVCAEKGDIFGNGDFWAPEVYFRNDKFYMFYTADEYLCVAVSTSPTGPFVKTSDSYIMSDFYCIDGNLLFDDDGSIYLYFSKVIKGGKNFCQEIWGCKMSDDLLSIDRSTLTCLLTPNGWESKTNEGPFVIKHDGTYYLTYSGNAYTDKEYSVGYATSASPLGGFEKYEQNPILKYNKYALGPGHHCFVMSPDDSEMFIVYHCHKSSQEVHPRGLYIDRVKFTENSKDEEIMSLYGPTVTPQPMPSK